MKRNATLLAPISLSETEKVGRRKFWKQILPVTEINYKGQKVAFDPKFHMDLADAFDKGAYDQVPLVFAGAANDHNMDPRNFGGDITKIEYRGPGKDEGTWALIEADKQAAKVIERNPKLGVSARIAQALEKADGRFFPRAVNHVLLTMNPRVSGMSPWQAVDLSEDTDNEVVDLTAQDYTEGNMMGNSKTRRSPSRRQIDLSTLSDEEFDNLLDLAQVATLTREDEDVDDDVVDEVDEVDDEEVEQPPTAKRRKSKVKVTKTTERDELVDDDDADEGDESDTDLSEKVTADEAERTQFQQMRIDLAEERWDRTRAGYLRDGVPGFLLDLAAPVLSSPDAITIDLAEGDETVDARTVVAGMLNGVKRIVDLTGEMGSAIDFTADEEETAEADALLAQWDKNYSA